MIAQRAACPQSSELADLLAGRLPQPRFANLVQHVDNCPECLANIEQSEPHAASDSVWSCLASTDQLSDQFERELECQAIVGQMLVQPFARSSLPATALPLESLGPYRLLKWLGSGGMGAVYLAEHQRLKRLAAIKLLPREKLLHSGWLDRFNREMTAIAALEHPHVVRAIDAGDEAGWHFLVMEYLDGLDLSKLCRRAGPLSIPAACELMRQAALGLGAIHELGMTHRDIKPSNLFLTRAGTLKLLDLGLVHSGQSPWTASERLTTVGHLMGTLPYMSREQLLDASGVDRLADIYSLGATGFHLLTGQAPYGTNSSLAQTIQAISSTDCPRIQAVRADVPEGVARLLDRMLNHDPQQRPHSAIEIAATLEDWADSHSTSVLVRTALSQIGADVAQDLTIPPASNAAAGALISGAAVAGSGESNSSSRWRWLVGLMWLPLAFLAGIVVTVVTDTGTLVIESTEPGVSVQVTQGEQLVQSLRIEQPPGSLRLRSGKYSIDIVGAAGDQLEISDQQIVLLRGERQVVKVQRRATDNSVAANSQAPGEGRDIPTGPQQVVKMPLTDLDTAHVYQGKPFSHWLSLLDREKDMAVIAQAMQAMGELAETDQQKLAAARQSLVVARRLGSMRMDSRPTTGVSNDPSGWFMTELADLYPNFYPEPGLQAIIEELEHGTTPSAQACLLLLNMYPQPLGHFSGQQLRELLASKVASESGRAQLERLDAALKKLGDAWVADPAAIFVQSWMRLRYLLVTTLGKAPNEDKQLVRAATGILEQAMQRRFANERSPLYVLDAMILSSVLPEHGNNSLIVLGLLEPGNIETNENELRTALAQLVKAYPQDTAAAIALHFARTGDLTNYTGGSRELGGPRVMSNAPPDATRRAAVAMQALLDNLPNGIEVVKHLLKSLKYTGPSIFKRSDIERLLQQVAIRLARESARSSAPEQFSELSRQQSMVAIHLAAIYGLPADRQSQVNVMAIMIGQFPQVPVDANWFLYPMPELDTSESAASLERWLSDAPRANIGEERPLRYSLQLLFDKYTESFISAYIQVTKADGFRAQQSELIGELLIYLSSKTPLEQRIDSQSLEQDQRWQRVVALQKLMSVEGGRLLADLIETHLIALRRFLQEQPVLDSESARQLHALLWNHLTITMYHTHVSPDNEVVLQGLQRLMAWACSPENATRPGQVSLGVIRYVARHAGYQSLRPALIMSVAGQLQSFDQCAEIEALIAGIHRAHPDEFVEYFLQQLERDAGALSEGRLLSTIATKARCDWLGHIVQPLLDNSTTRERAIVALKQLNLERLLPK